MQRTDTTIGERVQWKPAAVAGLAAAAGGGFAVAAFGVTVHNDVAPTLAWQDAAPSWLTNPGLNPLEHLWAFLAVHLTPDAYAVWPYLGALQLGLLAALVWALAARLLPGNRWAPPLAAVVTVMNGSVLHYVLSFNSVAILGVAVLVWVHARMSGASGWTRFAVAMVALSRADGAVLAGLLALEPLLNGKPPSRLSGRLSGRLRETVIQCAAVGACGLVWIALDHLVTGRFFGVGANVAAYSHAVPQARLSVFGAARWLRSAWLDILSEGTLVLFIVGALALWADGGSRSRPLLYVLASHHLVLAALGIAGSLLSYRYFTPDIALSVTVAAAGVCWIGGRMEGRRSAAAMVLVLAVWTPGYLGGLREFRDYGRANRSIESSAGAAYACLKPVLDGPAIPFLVVPGELRGALIYRLRRDRIAGIEFEKQFAARDLAPDAPVIWYRTPESQPPPEFMQSRTYRELACASGASVRVFD